MREKSAALEFGALILELGLKGIEVAPHVAQRLRYGRREIAIFGPGGSGKTTLATFLHFNHHYCFVSLAMNNMTTESGQVLAGISSGYDQML